MMCCTSTATTTTFRERASLPDLAPTYEGKICHHCDGVKKDVNVQIVKNEKTTKLVILFFLWLKCYRGKIFNILGS